MSNVQLPSSNRFDSHMQIYINNQNNDVSLANEFQKYLEKAFAKMLSLIRENTKKDGKKIHRQTVS